MKKNKIIYIAILLCLSVFAGEVEITASPGYNLQMVNKKSAVQYIKIKCINPGDEFTGTFKLIQKKEYRMAKHSLLNATVFEKTICQGTNEYDIYIPVLTSRIKLELYDEGDSKIFSTKLNTRRDKETATLLVSYNKLPFLYDFIKISPENLSDNWLAYDPFSRIIITPEAYCQITSNRWAAINKWVDSGGVLIMINSPADSSVFKKWRAYENDVYVLNQNCGRLIRMELPWNIYEVSSIIETNDYRIELWHKFVTQFAPKLRIGLRDWIDVDALDSYYDTYQEYFNINKFIKKLLLSENEKEKILKFAFIYIVLIVLITAPVNLLIWRSFKRARTGWLFTIILVAIGIAVCALANKMIRGDYERRVKISWHRDFDNPIVYTLDIFESPSYKKSSMEYKNTEWLEYCFLTDIINVGTIKNDGKNWRVDDYKIPPRAPLGIRTVVFTNEPRRIYSTIKFTTNSILVTVSNACERTLNNVFVRFGYSTKKLKDIAGGGITECLMNIERQKEGYNNSEERETLLDDILRFVPSDIFPIIIGGWEIETNKVEKSYKLFTSKSKIIFTDNCVIPYTFSKVKMFKEKTGDIYKIEKTTDLLLGKSYRYLLYPSVPIESGWRVSDYTVKIYKSCDTNDFKIETYNFQSKEWDELYNGKLLKDITLTPDKNPEKYIDQTDGSLWLKVTTKPENNASVNINKRYWQVEKSADFKLPSLKIQLKHNDD